MTNLAKLTAGAAVSLALAMPAQAHTGAHQADTLTRIIHWLSSPPHALFSVLGGLVASALIIHLVRKHRA